VNIISSNGINERQISEKCLKLLAAQRQLYRDCKNIDFLVFFFSVFVPLICAVVQTYFTSSNTIIAGMYILSLTGMFIGIFTTRYVEKVQEKASTIQVLFDLEVYQLPWDDKLFGKNIELTALIAEKSEKILSYNKEHESLLDWYPIKYDSVSLKEAIFLCQKANIRWDSKIRFLYKWSICILIGGVVLFILMNDINQNNSIPGFLSRLVFIIPLMQWLLTKVSSLNKDISRLENLKQQFLSDSDPNEEELLVNQSSIFVHRRECTLIPEWFYKINRKKQEHSMKIIADNEINNDE